MPDLPPVKSSLFIKRLLYARNASGRSAQGQRTGIPRLRCIHERTRAHRRSNRSHRVLLEASCTTEAGVACGAPSSHRCSSVDKLRSIPAEGAMRLASGLTRVRGQQEYFPRQAGVRGGAPVKVVMCVSIWVVRAASSRNRPKYTNTAIMMRVTAAHIHTANLRLRWKAKLASSPRSPRVGSCRRGYLPARSRQRLKRRATGRAPLSKGSQHTSTPTACATTLGTKASMVLEGPFSLHFFTIIFGVQRTHRRCFIGGEPNVIAKLIQYNVGK